MLQFVAGSLETRQVAGSATPMTVSGTSLEDLDPDLSANLAAAHRELDRTTGYRLPWDTLRVVALPGDVSAGSFAPGLILLGDRGTWSLSATRSLAQQWTETVLWPAWWSDVWVTEALAGILAFEAEAARHGNDFAVSARDDLMAAYLDEANRYRRPLVWDAFRTASDLRDAHARARGTLLLDQLAARLGPGAFGAAVRRFIARNAFREVDTERFLAAFSGGAGPDPQAFFDTWVYGSGHPVIEVSTEFDADAERLTIELRQVQDGPLVPTAFPFDTSVEWLLLGARGIDRLTMDDTELLFHAAVPIRPRYALLDTAGVVPAEWRYDLPMSAWGAALRYGSASLRLRAARALRSFADDPTVLLALRLAYDGERSPAVRREIVETAAVLEARTSVIEFLLRVLLDSDSSVRESAMRALGELAGPDSLMVTELESALSAIAQEDPDPAMQAAAVSALARSGAAGGLLIARSALITDSPDEVIRRAGLRSLRAAGAGEDLLGTAFLAHTGADSVPTVILEALALLAEDLRTQAVRRRVLELMRHPQTAVRLRATQQAAMVLTPANGGAVRSRLETEWHVGIRSAMAGLLEGLQGS
jgi:aminopeptidase N